MGSATLRLCAQLARVPLSFFNPHLHPVPPVESNYRDLLFTVKLYTPFRIFNLSVVCNTRRGINRRASDDDEMQQECNLIRNNCFQHDMSHTPSNVRCRTDRFFFPFTLDIHFASVYL